MWRPLYDHKSAYTGTLRGSEDDSSGSSNMDNLLLICNVSTVAFFTIEFFYASYILYKLLCKNERSRSLIFVTMMIIYSCLSLSVFFWVADENYYNS